jgi:hypothetical protein
MAETEECSRTRGNKLWTCNAEINLDEVIMAFRVWEQSYHIVKAWAQVYDDGERAEDIYFEKDADGNWYEMI